MNAPFPLALLAAGALAAPALAAGDAVIEFANANQDSLPGSLVAIRPDVLIWKSPLLTGPETPFLLGKVLSLTQASAASGAAPGDSDAVVTLTNGDVLRGRLSAIGDSQITLATPYAGELKLCRTMVKNLVIDSHPKLIFSGPSGMEGWKEISGTSNWTYKNNTLESSGSGGVFRDVAMPEMASLSFDLAWREAINLRFGIFCNEPNSSGFPDNGYEVECQRGFAVIRKRGGEGGGHGPEILGQPTQVPSLVVNEKAHFEIRGDRKNGRFQLLVDGLSVGDWEDPQPEPAKMGGGILFFAGDRVRLSRIRVAAWDGVIKPAKAEAEEKPKEEDKGKPKMRLRNGDVLVGDVVSIENDIMKVRTDFGDVILPVSRAESFSLKNAGYEEPILKNGDIRAWFPSGGSVTFRLDGFSDGKLRGFSQTFGEATFLLDAFSRLEFNLYDPEFDGLRNGRHDS